MLMLITYDVNTETREGRARLRRIAKACLNYGQRVQNSVFECVLDWGQFLTLKSKLEKIIYKNVDSLRYYNLGNNYKEKIYHIGAKPSINIEEPIVL